MIAVIGKILVAPASRDRFLALSSDAVRLARQAAGCHDYAVSPDPVEANRVNVCELWASQEALHAFRGDGPGQELMALVERVDVAEYDAAPRKA